MISIVTTVFNRKELLDNLFKSLLAQNNNLFEWIIIDDGSIEDLRPNIELYKEKANFDINYTKINHGGKHRALNVALTLVKYEAFCIVDSDDILLNDAVVFLHSWWEEIKDNEEFLGAAGLMINSLGEISGGEVTFDNSIDIIWTKRKDYGIKGESVYIFKKKYWTQFPFPEIENEDFLSEAAIMYQFSEKGLLIRWHKKVIYQYEYFDDGLTKNASEKRRLCPIGYAFVISKMKWNEWPKRNQYLEVCNRYYEECFNVIDNDNVREILGLTKEEKSVIEERIIEIVKQIKIKMNNYNVCSLYGYGKWGHIMNNYLRICNFEVVQIIDRQQIIYEKKDIDYQQKLLIVCIKELSSSEKSEIEKNYCDYKIVYMSEIYNSFF